MFREHAKRRGEVDKYLRILEKAERFELLDNMYLRTNKKKPIKELLGNLLGGFRKSGCSALYYASYVFLKKQHKM